MAKTKKIPIHLPLVITGYLLYALLIIAVILSTVIPWASMLFDPRTLHQNVAFFAIALTIGALLPVFLGYIIGDNSTNSKSKLSRHFDGVLFGLLAYWTMTILSVLMTIPSEYFDKSQNVWIVVVNLLPSVGVTIISAILAIAHLRSRHTRHNVIEYRPYGVVLLGATVLLPIWSLLQNILTQSVNWSSFVPLIIVAVAGAISYATLRHTKLSVISRLTWSAVSVSIAFVAVFVSSLLASGISNYINTTPTVEFQATVSLFGWVLALLGWAIYWRAQVRSLSKK